jgi:hypothetical protein
LLPGDWLVLAAGITLAGWLFATLWHTEPAGKVRIRSGDTVFATLSLDQERTIEVARAGQVAVCLPNRVSLELAGEKGYDSLNY